MRFVKQIPFFYTAVCILLLVTFIPWHSFAASKSRSYSFLKGLSYFAEKSLLRSVTKKIKINLTNLKAQKELTPIELKLATVIEQASSASLMQPKLSPLDRSALLGPTEFTKTYGYLNIINNYLSPGNKSEITSQTLGQLQTAFTQIQHIVVTDRALYVQKELTATHETYIKTMAKLIKAQNKSSSTNEDTFKSMSNAGRLLSSLDKDPGNYIKIANDMLTNEQSPSTNKTSSIVDDIKNMQSVFSKISKAKGKKRQTLIEQLNGSTNSVSQYLVENKLISLDTAKQQFGYEPPPTSDTQTGQGEVGQSHPVTTTGGDSPPVTIHEIEPKVEPDTDPATPPETDLDLDR